MVGTLVVKRLTCVPIYLLEPLTKCVLEDVWFLYDNGLRLERVKGSCFKKLCNICRKLCLTEFTIN